MYETNLCCMHLFHIVSGTANPDEDVLFAVDNENIAFVHQRPRHFRKLAHNRIAFTFDRVQCGVEFISHMFKARCGSTGQNPTRNTQLPKLSAMMRAFPP